MIFKSGENFNTEEEKWVPQKNVFGGVNKFLLKLKKLKARTQFQLCNIFVKLIK